MFDGPVKLVMLSGLAMSGPSSVLLVPAVDHVKPLLLDEAGKLTLISGLVAVPPIDSVPVEPLVVTVPAVIDRTSLGKLMLIWGLAAVPLMEAVPTPGVAVLSILFVLIVWTPFMPAGPCGPCCPCSPWGPVAPVAPVAPCGPVFPIGP